MTNGKRQIGICGTFDLENYGDLLFPLIAEAELQKRLGPIKLQRFSYWEKTPPEWPYTVHSLTQLPAMIAQLDALLIGGGDLIRFDKGVAPGYAPPTPSLHLPGGYWLTPALIALQRDCPVIWNAPGAYGDVPTWAMPLLELALNLSNYLAVRDIESQQALKHFAPNTTINLVPDTAFGAAQLVNLAQPSAEYRNLCASTGLKSPYIIVQATTGVDIFLHFVQQHPEIFQDYQFLILPIGPVLGDNTTIFEEQLPRSIRPQSWPGPLLLTELIGRASAAVGTSLHLSIVSLAFGLPVFRPTATGSYRKYAILNDFETITMFGSTPIDPDWFVTRLQKRASLPIMQEIAHRLTRHWDEIAAIIAAGETKAATRESIGHLWESIPNLLEGGELRYLLAQKELARQQDEINALIDERNRLNEEYQLTLARHAAEIAAIYTSNSWKITSPLRALRRNLNEKKPKPETKNDKTDQY